MSFTRGTPETILPKPGSEVSDALAGALAEGETGAQRRVAVSAVAARWPRSLEAWASLAEIAEEAVDRYAFARVGYHRGLDALRAAGWRGTGFVRWEHPENRGFLRSLDALRRAAGVIGETDEEQRCALFLRQLDPQWMEPSAAEGSPAGA